jgi:predicted O-linked N-acetylglucosamine transferase (SPINDLY family)
MPHPARLLQAVDLHRLGRLDEAAAACRDVLASEPDNTDATHLLGVIAHQKGDEEQALSFLDRAAAAAPGVAQIRSNLAAVCRALGRTDEALAHAAEAVRLAPDSAEAHNNQGVALEDLGRPGEAAEAYRRAASLRPGYAEAQNNLGNALRKLGRLDEAVGRHREAIRLSPSYGPAYNNLAQSLGDLGQPDEALTLHRRRVELEPSSASAHSAMLTAMLYPWGCGREDVFEAHRRWAARHAERLYPADGGQGPSNNHEPSRQLRIGYVSADFREHPVARLMAGILRSLDRERFELTCYSDTDREDGMTQALRTSADRWRDTARLSDVRLCDLIRQDRIDVLVDLSGHMSGNRLLAFARRAAPLQVSHFGYPETTGLRAMDWRITDAHADPPGASERFHTERLIRLPHTAWCYDPGPQSVPVADPPVTRTGRVTFGCLNNPLKVTPQMIALWAEVLRRVRGSRILLLSGARDGSGYVREQFARHGVPNDAVEFVRKRGRAEYLASYSRVDVALDPSPYGGGVTTCDALWMGVPVVSLAGDSYRSRQGVLLLANVGLPEFVAGTAASYAETAVGAAAAVDRLAALRRQLRDRLASSPLMNVANYTSHLQAAYESMWRSRAGGLATTCAATGRDAPHSWA